MKALTLLILLILTCTFSQANAQEIDELEKIWVSVDDPKLLPKSVNGQLVSESAEFQTVINQFKIKTSKQILPDSRKENLLKVYEMSCDCDQNELINALNNRVEGLSKAEPAPVYTPLYNPNDYTIAFTEDYALDLIGAVDAWDINMGDTTVKIAISDTDYDLDHQELEGTVSYVQPDITYPSYYHGTAVAITAGGNTDNEIGKSSIGSNCMLQLYKMEYNSLILATYNGAKVINLSWTSGCFYSDYYQNIIDEVYENGSIVVSAAGNGGICSVDSYLYPASLNHVISVSSIGPSDNHEKTIGDPSTTHQHNDSVDICAPGYDVALTVQDGWYLTGNGSSFASPYVAGTIGLMISENPCLTFEEIETILKTTAVNVDALNPAYAGMLGAGRLNAAEALEMTKYYSNFDIELDGSYSCDDYQGVISATTVSGEGVGPYSFLWNTMETTETIGELESGTYTVTVIDAEGCKSLDSITLDIPEAITIEATTLNTSCFESADGSIDINLTGGIGPFDIEWDNGSVTEDLNDLPAGVYELTVYDVDGCSTQSLIEIAEPDEIQITAEIINDDDNTGSGEINLSVTGGTPSYIYSWSNEETTESITGLEAGVYTVEIEDANNCTKTAEFKVIGSTVSLTENDLTGFNVYPNPAVNGQVNISWNNNEVKQLELINQLGQVVQIIQPQNTDLVTLNELAKGIYTIRVSDNMGNHQSRMLMVH